MRMTASSIVTNEAGELLLIQRHDIRHSLAHEGTQPLQLAQPMTLTHKAGKKVLGRILFPIQC